MDLIEYLKSFNAKMDIVKMLNGDEQRRECSTLPGLYLHNAPGKPWSRCEVRTSEGSMMAFCSWRRIDDIKVTGFKDVPNIPIYTADDLGEAVRALGRATGATKWSEGQIAAMAEATARPEFDGSNFEATDADLPGALCRVLLASYQISALADDDRFRQ